MTAGDGDEVDVDYAWYIDDEFYADSESISVPLGTEAGTVITLTVTDDDGNEASDSVTVVEDLALEKVESAGRIVATALSAGGVNILVAYFSSEMNEINPADVEIRRVSDNKLFTVEKITMTSDMMTATMTLTGTAAAAANTEYLQPNVPYRMIINDGEQLLSKEFIIPNVLDNAVVTAVNADDEKIELDGVEYGLADGITVDNYFELLGKTVTAEVDETGLITSYNVANLKTIIGAFKYTAGTATANATYKEVVSETVYKTTDTDAANASTYATQTVQYNDSFAAGDTDINVDAVGTDNDMIPGTDLAWGKIVLNPNGTIRTIQGIATTPNSAYVTANDEGVIKNGASIKVNLKDYVIIDGEQTIDKEDVAEDDIFFYNAADQVGYIYNNPIEGVFTKNYGTKFVFDGEEYSQAITTVKDSKEAALTSDALDDLIKAETEMTLYTDISGTAKYAIGEAAASTSTVKLFVTSSGTSGTGDAASASITGFNPATEAMETYSWKGTSLVALATVNTWNSADHTTQVPVLVKLTVNAEDGTTVKKVEVVDEAYDVSVGPTFLNGKDTTQAPLATTVDEIKSSTKLIGSTATDGMDPASSKVVIYKNPAKATTAWKAENFKVVDFADWTGKLVESTVNSGVFAGTHIYGTLSKTVDLIFVEGKTAQTSAGSIGIEAGTPFVGFVTEKLDGTSKRVKAITANGEQTYETFFSDNETAALAASVVGTFVVITPSKTFDEDETIYDIDALAADTYAIVPNADYAAYTSEGTSLTTAKNDATGYKDFDLASDVLVIKKTVKGASTSYALSTATAISKYSPVAVYNAAGNTTIAKMVLFAEPDTATGDADAISTKTALTTAQQGTMTTNNATREAEKATIAAMKFTVGSLNATTVTVTNSDTSAAADAMSAGAAPTDTVVDGSDAGLTTASGVTTFKQKANGGPEIVTVTITGTYYTRTLSYDATVAGGVFTVFDLEDDTTVLN